MVLDHACTPVCLHKYAATAATRQRIVPGNGARLQADINIRTVCQLTADFPHVQNGTGRPIGMTCESGPYKATGITPNHHCGA